MSRPADTPPATLPGTAPAWFGKLPSRGDFLRSAGPSALVPTLDRWLTEGLERTIAGTGWQTTYDRGAAADFAVVSARSPRVVVGHLVASRDRVGRRFPFVMAAALEVPAPGVFLPLAPLALTPPWQALEQACAQAQAAADGAAALAGLAARPIVLDQPAAADAARRRHFGDQQTLGSLQALLRAAGHAVDLRRTLMALGLLMRPVRGSDLRGLRRGLSLPLPAEAPERDLAASFWLHVVSPFVAHADVELALYRHRREGRATHRLSIGFNGTSPEHLHAVFDAGADALAFIDLVDVGWVDDAMGHDPTLLAVSDALLQPGLSLRRVLALHQLAFLRA